MSKIAVERLCVCLEIDVIVGMRTVDAPYPSRDSRRSKAEGETPEQLAKDCWGGAAGSQGGSLAASGSTPGTLRDEVVVLAAGCRERWTERGSSAAGGWALP